MGISRAAQRRSAAATMAARIDEMTDGGRTIIDFAVRVLHGEEFDMVDRRWAAQFLAERRAGKAVQVVEQEITATLSDGTDVRRLSEAQLERLLAAHREVAQLTDGEDQAELVEAEDE